MKYPLLPGEVQVIRSAFPAQWRFIVARLETFEGKTLADRMERLKADTKKKRGPRRSPSKGVEFDRHKTSPFYFLLDYNIA